MDLLSNEILYNIMLYININELKKIKLVNTIWKNIIMDDILWKDKLYIDYKKDDKGNFHKWYDRYKTAYNNGKIAICRLPKDGSPGLGYDIVIGHNLGNEVTARLLPYEGIKCIYGFNYIAIITEHLQLKIIDVVDRIENIIDEDVTDIIHGGADCMIYIKASNIWSYVHDGFEKTQMVTCGEMITKVSYSHPYISYLDGNGKYNRRWYNDATEAWELIMNNIEYNDEIQQIADVGSDVILFTNMKPISINSYLSKEIMNIISDNKVHRMDCNLAFYVKDIENIILLDIDYDFDDSNQCRGYILNNDFEGVNNIKCVSVSCNDVIALRYDGIGYLRFYNYDMLPSTVDCITELNLKIKSIHSGYNISMLL